MSKERRPPTGEPPVPCRGCGEERALIVVSCCGNEPRERLEAREHVVCFRCQMAGPSVPSTFNGVEDAWAAWNRVNGQRKMQTIRGKIIRAGDCVQVEADETTPRRPGLIVLSDRNQLAGGKNILFQNVVIVLADDFEANARADFPAVKEKT